MFFLFPSHDKNAGQDQSGYNFPTCVQINAILDKLQTLYGCTIKNASGVNNPFMIFKPKFRKYVKFNISAATLYQAEGQDGKGIPWGYIADDTQ